MRVIKKVSFEEVEKYFDLEHPIKAGAPGFEGNEWGQRIIKGVDILSDGKWALCELESEEIYSIILPSHSGEGGETGLIDDRGLSVKDALSRLASISDYHKRNPVCWSKMNYWRDKSFVPLFLSTIPGGSGRHDALDPKKGKLFHLDGLHRLMVWGNEGRFEPEVYNRRAKLLAYVAGVE